MERRNGKRLYPADVEYEGVAFLVLAMVGIIACGVFLWEGVKALPI